MAPHREGASPFNALEKAFVLLGEGPHPVTVSGTDVLGLPKRPIPLIELRSRMLHPSCRYAVRDAVLDTLLRRAQAEGSAWVVALAGMLLPGLRRASVPLVRACPERADDVQGEMLAGLIAAIGAACPGRSRPAARLVWAARRSAEHLLREELAEQDRSRLLPSSAAPPRPFGHPDLVLARAVAEGAVCAEDAELIGATRLGELNLRDAADVFGVSYAAIKARRARDWLAFVIFLALAVAATYRLPRYWRGEVSVIPSMSRWWPFGGPLLRGWERSMPAAFAAGWSLIVAFVTGWLAAVGKRTDSQPLHDLAYVGIAAIGVFFLSLFVMAAVVLINRPKFIVPPHLRQQPGAVMEWFRAIRRRRGSRHAD